MVLILSIFVTMFMTVSKASFLAPGSRYYGNSSTGKCTIDFTRPGFMTVDCRMRMREVSLSELPRMMERDVKFTVDSESEISIDGVIRVFGPWRLLGTFIPTLLLHFNTHTHVLHVDIYSERGVRIAEVLCRRLSPSDWRDHRIPRGCFSSIDGARFAMPNRTLRLTNDEAAVELMNIAGDVDLFIRARREGQVSILVRVVDVKCAAAQPSFNAQTFAIIGGAKADISVQKLRIRQERRGGISVSLDLVDFLTGDIYGLQAVVARPVPRLRPVKSFRF